MCFLVRFPIPLKSAFGANLVPTWYQNDLKKWSQEGPRRHQKSTLSQKLKNSNPCIIYYTLAMSATPKKHQFWSLKSLKIDEKSDLEKQLIQNSIKCLQITFFSNFGSQLGPWGGSANALFRWCLSFWAVLGPTCLQELPKSPQNHPMPPFLHLCLSCVVRFRWFFTTINAEPCRK